MSKKTDREGKGKEENRRGKVWSSINDFGIHWRRVTIGNFRGVGQILDTDNIFIEVSMIKLEYFFILGK